MNEKTKVGLAVGASFLALAGGVMGAKHLGRWVKLDRPQPPLAVSPEPEKKPAAAGEEPQQEPATGAPLYQAPPPLAKAPAPDLDVFPSKSAPPPPAPDLDPPSAPKFADSRRAPDAGVPNLSLPPVQDGPAPAGKPIDSRRGVSSDLGPPNLSMPPAPDLPPPAVQSVDRRRDKAVKSLNSQKDNPAADDPFEPAPLPPVKRAGHDEPVPALSPPGAAAPSPKKAGEKAPVLDPITLGDSTKKPARLIDLPELAPPGGEKSPKPKTGVSAPPPPLEDLPAPKLNGITRTSNPTPDAPPGLTLPGTGSDKNVDKKDVKAPAVDDKKGPPALPDLSGGPVLPVPGEKKEPAPGPKKDQPLTIPGPPGDKPAGPKPAAPELTKPGDATRPPPDLPTVKPADKAVVDPPPVIGPKPAADVPPLSLDAKPTGAPPVALGGARPEPAAEPEPPITSYDEEWYYCKPDDTLEAISQKFFFSTRYAQALRKYNLDRNYRTVFRQERPALGQGEVVKVPPARILERNYPDAIPGYKPGSAPRPAAPTAGPAAGREDLGTPREYTVRREGMTLRDIAREELRDEKQWTRIFVLNREWNPSAPVPVGTRIFLPSAQ